MTAKVLISGDVKWLPLNDLLTRAYDPETVKVTVLFSEPEPTPAVEQTSVYIFVEHANEKGALKEVQAIFDLVRSDREAFVRRAPIAQTDKNFETGKWICTATARLHVLNRPGQTQGMFEGLKLP